MKLKTINEYSDGLYTKSNNQLNDICSIITKTSDIAKDKFIKFMNTNNINVDYNILLSCIEFMPHSKQIHSIKVAKNVWKLTSNIDLMISGLLHDYIEQGGNITDLNVNTYIKNIITVLTEDDDLDTNNNPLENLKIHINTIHDSDLKNNILLIKLCDRMDNVKNRKDKITTEYMNKTNELITYIAQTYTGQYNLQTLIDKKS